MIIQTMEWILLVMALCKVVLPYPTVDVPLNSPPLVKVQPRHVHLALGESPNSLSVTWSTVNKTGESIALLYVDGKEEQFKGAAKQFVDGGEKHLSQWIHKVVLSNLKSSHTYRYRVGSHLGWSDVFEMRTLPSGENWSPRLALFGDMGNENAVSLPMIQREVGEGVYDAIIHVGDMAYDMADKNGVRGDIFMDQIEPIASMVPYMTCPGNHEWHYNFSNYKARFNMPGDNRNMFFSFDIGPVHFVSISTEFYYFLNYGLKPVIAQYTWLEKDLTSVDRSKHPWIVLFGHRPMYCTNKDRDDCTKFETRTRTGLPLINWWGLEQLLMDYGVDLAVWAHEHSYERLLPTFNRTVVPSPDMLQPYSDPSAPVHITTGSAGCREKHDDFGPSHPDWSAFRSTDYGYTRLQVANTTHIRVQQVSAEKDGEVIDDIWIVQHNHGPFKVKIVNNEF
eukprot:GFUD01000684.1.p1 GENE.GFUD01000684.1~~GFUD01000684.1.p1  ORF type:complete len:450 (+),score=123.28 GFUD01000684.1:126-1475(+)